MQYILNKKSLVQPVGLLAIFSFLLSFSYSTVLKAENRGQTLFDLFDAFMHESSQPFGVMRPGSYSSFVRYKLNENGELEVVKQSQSSNEEELQEVGPQSEGMQTQSKPDELANDINQVTFADIAGIDNVVNEVAEIVDFLKNPEKYERLGAKIPTGILLEGPPGVGKTLIAKAVANEAGCNFIDTTGSAFVELYVGQGAARVRELFDKARQSTPAIIFIDEIDAVGAARDSSGSGSREYDQTLNELLTQMEGFHKNNRIIVIAATNRADMLDAALKRPGRFTKILPVTLPDQEARKAILQLYIDKLPLVNKEDIDIENLAKRTERFSGAELAHCVNNAALQAVRIDAERVEQEHIESALNEALTTKRVRSTRKPRHRGFE